MHEKDYYKVGFIMRPHGLKGAVTVSCVPDSPADWSTLESVFVEKNNSLVPYFIESVSTQMNKVFLKFEEVTTPEQAALLKNHSLYLPKSTRPKPETGDFYDDEVLDYEVMDEHLGAIGKVAHIERAGLNRFLIVDHNNKEVMIPAQHPLMKSINRSKKRITVNLPDGFLDI